MSNIYEVLVGKPERWKTFVRPSLVSEDNIKVDVKEIVWGCGRNSFSSG
jgi:hypothetical protein